MIVDMNRIMLGGTGMNNELYGNVINKLPIGYAYHRIILDDEGQPLDYEFLDANQLGKEYISTLDPNIIGKKFSEVVPQMNDDAKRWIETCGEVALMGGTKEFEQYSFAAGKRLKLKVWSPEKNILLFILPTLQKK